jgi:hypothetical protein
VQVRELAFVLCWQWLVHWQWLIFWQGHSGSWMSIDARPSVDAPYDLAGDRILVLCAPEDMWMPLWKFDQMLKSCPGIQVRPQ